MIRGLLAATVLLLVTGCSSSQPDVIIEDQPTEIGGAAETALLVIGDSFTSGSPMNTGPTWPDLIAQREEWVALRDGVDGSGYVEDGLGQSIEDRLPQDIKQYAPDLVVFAGGRNDVNVAEPDEIATAVERVIGAAQDAWPDADIVLLSPFSSGPPDERTIALTQALEAVAEKADVPYVDVSDALTAEMIGDDTVHPTDAGHERLADVIDKALRGYGVP